jgi:putative ABC transport system permease protein
MLPSSIRQSVRSLLRVPGLTAISVLTVALGVGAGTSLFSVVKAVLLNPLPYPDSQRIVSIDELSDHGTTRAVAYGNFRDWAATNRSFTAMAVFGGGPVNVSVSNTERIEGTEITGSFFDVMGVHPVLGRSFVKSEEVEGGPATAVIGDSVWRRMFGADPNILGRSLRLGGKPMTVVGVMPQGFQFPGKSEIWISAGAMGDLFDSRTAHNFRAVGRLRSGVTYGQANSDISSTQRHLFRQFPGAFMSPDASVTPLAVEMAGKVRLALVMLFGAVGFLLLIVCVNVANLLLVRVTARARELAVRRALGAGHRQLIGQMLTESLALALAGGAVGLLIALWSMELLKILLPADMPRVAEIRIDGGVLAFALAVSAAAGVLFGLLPAWRAVRMNLHEAIKSGSRSYTAGRSSHRLQSALVISEVSLSLVLLAGAGLLINSFVRLRAVDPGFRTEHILTANLEFSSMGGDAPRLRAEYTDLLARVRAIPGVIRAGMTDQLPLDGYTADGSFRIENRKAPEGADAAYSVIGPGYLRTMRIPLLSGRDFSESDTTNSPGVAILSAEMARQYWPGRNPIGDRIWFESFEQKQHWLTIVGVAADVRLYGLTARKFPQAYVCYTQAERIASGALAIETPLAFSSIEPAVRKALTAVDREVTVEFRPMAAVVAASVARQRFQMQILGAFAILALLLAAVGLYGVLSYLVTSNRVEIGIRMALGAQPGGVFRMVAGRAVALAAFGAAVGLVGCLAVRRVLASMLFGIGPSDPATLATAAAVLIAVALAAASVPALRAMRVDPMAALRED